MSRHRTSTVDRVPAERLAALRILVGGYALVYLLVRLPVFAQLRLRRTGFDGAGVFVIADEPLGSAAFTFVLVLTLALGLGFVLGARFRLTGPLFAVGVLILTSYRASWGQLLHFDNLMVLHLLVVALSPAADAWSVDARFADSPTSDPERSRRQVPNYGGPIALAGLTTVVTYVIAGIAKLRYGGLDWMLGDTLRNHVAYSAARLDVLGGTPSPFAPFAVERGWMLPGFAIASVAVELSAPIALLGGRWRNTWVAAAWAMHVGILAFMLIAFGYPLFLVAFAPFFRLERLARVVPMVGASRRGGLRAPTPS